MLKVFLWEESQDTRASPGISLRDENTGKGSYGTNTNGDFLESFWGEIKQGVLHLRQIKCFHYLFESMNHKFICGFFKFLKKVSNGKLGKILEKFITGG